MTPQISKESLEGSREIQVFPERCDWLTTIQIVLEIVQRSFCHKCIFCLYTPSLSPVFGNKLNSVNLPETRIRSAIL